MALRLPRVLVVDAPAGAQDVVSILSANGYRPTAVESAEAALDVLGTEEVDLVLLDIRLPGMDGHALLRVIRRSAAELPVIMTAASASVEDPIRAFRANAADFLCKPISCDELVASVERALAGPGGSQRELPAYHPGPAVGRGAGPAAPAHRPDPQRPAPAAVAPRPLRPEPRPATRPAPAAEASAASAAAAAPRSIRELIHDAGQRLKRGGLELPVLDPRIPQIHRLMEKPTSGVDEVLAVVGRDPTLASIVLRVSNSSYYNSSGRQVSDLRQACVQLGNQRVMAVAIEALVQSSFVLGHEPFRSILPAYWRNAFVTARATDWIARRLHRTTPQARALLPGADSLYVAALMHNVGELFLFQVLSEAGLLVAPDGLPELIAEVARWHEGFGRTLARAWSLPPLVIRLAGQHHRPTAPREPDHERLVRNVLLAAWTLSLANGFTYLPGHESAAPGEFLDVLGLRPEDTAALETEMGSWLDDDAGPRSASAAKTAAAEREDGPRSIPGPAGAPPCSLAPPTFPRPDALILH